MSGFNLPCSAALALTALAFPAAAQLTVGPTGSGATFQEIGDALAVATLGETILVAAGDYAPFVVTQGVSIVGAGSDLTHVHVVNGTTEGAIDITLIPAGQAVRISGLSIGRATATTDERIEVKQCAGRVELVDVQALRVNSGSVYSSESPTVLVEDCASVLFDDCVLRGTYPSIPQFWMDANTSLDVINSSVWINGCDLMGTAGNEGHGSEALRVTAGSFVHITSSQLMGGSGGSHFGFEWWDIYGHNSEEAIYLADSEVILAGGTDNRIEGAEGYDLTGFDWTGGGAAVEVGENGTLRYSSDTLLIRGLDGDGSGATYPVFHDFATGTLIEAQPVLRPTLRMEPAGVQPGQVATLQTSGNPGATHLTFASFTGISPIPLGSAMHVHLNPAAAILLPTITLDAAGLAQLPVNVPTNPALAGLVLTMQTLDTDPTALRLSNPALLTILR